MGLRRLHALGLTVALALLPAARPALALTWDPPDCRRGSPALAEAEALEQRILRGLDDPTTSLRPLVEAVFAHRCLRRPRRLFREPLPADEAAVRAWLVRGGHEWLRSTLKRRPEIVMISFAPSFRPWLDATTVAPDDPMAPFVCRPGDEACIDPAAGWLHRARRERRATARQARWPHACTGERRVETWARCVLEGARRAEQRVLPDGHFGAPRAGQLVWTAGGGRPELWLFDLASARAARGRLEHGSGGSRGGWTVHTGRVARANLDEALLLLALGTVSTTVTHAIRHDVYHYGPKDGVLDVGAVLDTLPPLGGGAGGLGTAGGPRRRVAWSFAATPGGRLGLGQDAEVMGNAEWAGVDSIHLEVTRLGFVSEARPAVPPETVRALSELAGTGRAGHEAVRRQLASLLAAAPPKPSVEAGVDVEGAQPGEH
jgi:hypothetical protein